MSDPIIAVPIPEKLSHRIWPFIGTDYWFGGCAGLVVFITWLRYGMFLGLLALVAGGCLTLVRLDYGRPYYVFGQWCSGWWLMRWPRYGELWSRSEPAASDEATETSTSRARRLSFRQKAGPIPLELHAIGNLGLVYYLEDNTDSVIIEGDGSDIPGQDLETQYGVHEAIAETIKRAASIRGYVVNVSFVFRRRPADIRREIENELDNNYPDTVLPPRVSSSEPLTKDQLRFQRINDNQVLLREQVVPTVGAEITMVMVLSIRRSGLLASSKGSLAEDDVNSLPIIELATSARESLRSAGIINPRILTPTEVRDYLRESWDVGDLSDYNQRRSDGTDYPELELQWPQRVVRVEKKLALFDSTAHTVLRVTRTGRQAALPHYMRQIYAISPRWVTITLVGSALRSTGDEWAIGKIVDLTDTLRTIGGESRERPGQRKRRESLLEQEETLSDSRYVQNFNLLIAIANDKERVHARDISTAIRELEHLGLTVKVITGPRRQTRAVWSAAGINML